MELMHICVICSAKDYRSKTYLFLFSFLGQLWFWCMHIVHWLLENFHLMLYVRCFFIFGLYKDFSNHCRFLMFVAPMYGYLPSQFYVLFGFIIVHNWIIGNIIIREVLILFYHFMLRVDWKIVHRHYLPMIWLCCSSWGVFALSWILSSYGNSNISVVGATRLSWQLAQLVTLMGILVSLILLRVCISVWAYLFWVRLVYELVLCVMRFILEKITELIADVWGNPWVRFFLFFSILFLFLTFSLFFYYYHYYSFFLLIPNSLTLTCTLLHVQFWFHRKP